METTNMCSYSRISAEFIQSLITVGQETCETVKELFDTLGETFRLQHIETVLSLQYCELV